MNVARRSLRLGRPLHRPLLVQSRRNGSSDAHHHGNEHHHEDPAVYTQESFFTPFWRNTLIISLLGLGLYNFGPSGVPITKWIASVSPKKEDMDKLNQANLIAAAVTAEDGLVTARAQRPYIHRYRSVGSFEGGSPHNVPLGSGVDMSELVIRSDYELRHTAPSQKKDEE